MDMCEGHRKAATIARSANETSRGIGCELRRDWLLDMTAGTLIPLVWSTSVEFGGLSMSPASIGLWMAGYGFLNGIFQFVAFPRIVGRFGPRRVFIASVLCFFPVYMMFPFENLALHHSSRGLNVAAALLIMLQLSVMSFSDMGFSKLP
jgi:hypothetical protein